MHGVHAWMFSRSGFIRSLCCDYARGGLSHDHDDCAAVCHVDGTGSRAVDGGRTSVTAECCLGRSAGEATSSDCNATEPERYRFACMHVAIPPSRRYAAEQAS